MPTLIGPPTITAAALAIIEDEGPDGLTMRRLADRLGVTATAIYYHFAGRQALLDAVADELAVSVGAAAAHATSTATTRWQDQIEAAMAGWFERTKQHPVAMGWMMTAYAFAPPMLRLHEALLEILAHSDLDDDDVLLLKGALLRFAIGNFVIGEQRADKPRADTVSAEFTRYRALAPAMARFDPDEQFYAGIRALLAGWPTARPH